MKLSTTFYILLAGIMVKLTVADQNFSHAKRLLKYDTSMFEDEPITFSSETEIDPADMDCQNISANLFVAAITRDPSTCQFEVQQSESGGNKDEKIEEAQEDTFQESLEDEYSPDVCRIYENLISHRSALDSSTMQALEEDSHGDSDHLQLKEFFQQDVFDQKCSPLDVFKKPLQSDAQDLQKEPSLLDKCRQLYQRVLRYLKNFFTVVRQFLVVFVKRWQYKIETFANRIQNNYQKVQTETKFKIQGLKSRKNFASSKSGASVIKSSAGIINKNAILEPSDDKYLIGPSCRNEQVIINLSDDVQVDTILISNQEDFSANFQLIKFMGSIDYPPAKEQWIELGSIEPDNADEENRDFESDEGVYFLDLSKSGNLPMIRYLKVMFEENPTPQGSELDQGLFCTLTSLKVYGSSMHMVMRDSLLDLVQPEASPNTTHVVLQAEKYYVGPPRECQSQNYMSLLQYGNTDQELELEMRLYDEWCGNSQKDKFVTLMQGLDIEMKEHQDDYNRQVSVHYDQTEYNNQDDLQGLLKKMVSKLNNNEDNQRLLNEQLRSFNQILQQTFNHTSLQLQQTQERVLQQEKVEEQVLLRMETNQQLIHELDQQVKKLKLALIYLAVLMGAVLLVYLMHISRKRGLFPDLMSTLMSDSSQSPQDVMQGRPRLNSNPLNSNPSSPILNLKRERILSPPELDVVQETSDSKEQLSPEKAREFILEGMPPEEQPVKHNFAQKLQDFSLEQPPVKHSFDRPMKRFYSTKKHQEQTQHLNLKQVPVV